MSETTHYDVIVIGAGTAGYVAAIRAAQLGLKSALIDEWRDSRGEQRLGGTCLHVGCIPSKALLKSSDYYHKVRHELAEHGITCSELTLDLAQMMRRKQQLIDKLTAGIKTLLQANGVQLIAGRGRLLPEKRVEVTTFEQRVEQLAYEHAILATGSRPVEITQAPVDHQNIVDSTDALAFDEVPKRLGVIGAGVIGLELGSIWSRLGSKVVLLEAQESFLSMLDETIAHLALKEFRRQGLDIRLGARVISSSVGKKQISVSYQQGEEELRVLVDKLLVAVGRTPNTADLTSDELALLLDERGAIHVDSAYRTNLPGVYAIGDAIRGPMLAHKGSEEGIRVAEMIAGSGMGVAPVSIPGVIYTSPEIAWVGESEQKLQAAATPYRVGQFAFAANGRAVAMGEGQGLVKIISHAESDRILGVHIIGPMASELLATAVVAMEFEGSAEDLARTIFAHPTLSEALHEAALAVDGRAIHWVATKRP
ncbi:dihydrolipoyl dehydrogenase [Ectothiorhodospiraceae bacterium BW-2]|nr:dihydrolipoyl dehydrogenase [Ectothiorhodospiraceae bacterium BW-2]